MVMATRAIALRNTENNNYPPIVLARYDVISSPMKTSLDQLDDKPKARANLMALRSSASMRQIPLFQFFCSRTERDRVEKQPRLPAKK